MVEPVDLKAEIESLPFKIRDIIRIEATDRGTVRMYEYESSQDRMIALQEVYEPIKQYDYVGVFERTVNKNIASVEYRITTNEMSDDDLTEFLETLGSVWDDREQLSLGEIP